MRLHVCFPKKIRISYIHPVLSGKRGKGNWQAECGGENPALNWNFCKFRQLPKFRAFLRHVVHHFQLQSIPFQESTVIVCATNTNNFLSSAEAVQH